MVTPRKLNILFALPSYGGNGGIASEVPDVRRWYTKTILACKQDPRIGAIDEITLADTPITMVRNRFVVKGRELGSDVICMIDSDMNPNLHLGEAHVKEFFSSSFDFLYDHYDKGPCVIGAPYCGPPGGKGCENMYVFEWQNYGDHGDESHFTLEQIPRMMASRMAGIQPVAALPTGLILYDIRAFKLIEPVDQTREQVLDDLLAGLITKQQALRRLHQGWFYYEWVNNFADSKASTEDVTNTRDISLAGVIKLGYNPVYCNWDAPVGHWKPWCVRGRPTVYDAMSVAQSYRNCVLHPLQGDEALAEASFYSHLDRHEEGP